MCKLLEVAVLGSVSVITFGLNVAIAGATVYLAVKDASKTVQEEMKL